MIAVVKDLRRPHQIAGAHTPCASRSSDGCAGERIDDVAVVAREWIRTTLHADYEALRASSNRCRIGARLRCAPGGDRRLDVDDRRSRATHREARGPCGTVHVGRLFQLPCG